MSTLTYSTTFKWKIEDFNLMASRSNENMRLQSGDFCLNDRRATICCLMFMPKNERPADEESKKYSSVLLFCKNLLGGETVFLTMKFWIENSQKRVIAETEGENTFYSNSTGYGLRKFISHKELYERNFVKDNWIYICCQIWSRQPNKFAIMWESELREKLWLYYRNDINGMCTLKVDNREFHVEKKMLFANSPVFEKMFTVDMLEAKEKAVEIKKTNAETMEQLVEYFYRGQVEKLDKNAEMLYKLAHRYEVNGLMSKCITSMKKSINNNNVLHRLVLSFIYDEVELKNTLLHYVVNQTSGCSFDDIISSNEWTQLCSRNLMLSNEITRAVIAKMQDKH